MYYLRGVFCAAAMAAPVAKIVNIRDAATFQFVIDNPKNVQVISSQRAETVCSRTSRKSLAATSWVWPMLQPALGARHMRRLMTVLECAD